MGAFVLREVVLGMETMVQLTRLSPFTAYECFVTANTSAGAGNASNQAVEITNEAGRLMFEFYLLYLIQCRAFLWWLVRATSFNPNSILER